MTFTCRRSQAHPGQGVPFRQPQASGVRARTGTDHLYSVAALTNASGAVVERYGYDAYGKRIILDGAGTTVRTASAYGQNYGFTGREYDAETGLWYFRARMYSDRLGRFISRDPLQYVNGRYNQYFIAFINSIDPSGKIDSIVAALLEWVSNDENIINAIESAFSSKMDEEYQGLKVDAISDLIQLDNSIIESEASMAIDALYNSEVRPRIIAGLRVATTQLLNTVNQQFSNEIGQIGSFLASNQATIDAAIGATAIVAVGTAIYLDRVEGRKIIRSDIYDGDVSILKYGGASLDIHYAVTQERGFQSFGATINAVSLSNTRILGQTGLEFSARLSAPCEIELMLGGAPRLHANYSGDFSATIGIQSNF